MLGEDRGGRDGVYPAEAKLDFREWGISREAVSPPNQLHAQSLLGG